jgi:transposase
MAISYNLEPHDVTDDEWRIIAQLLPEAKKHGRPPVDARRTLNGILYVERNHCPWRMMPRHYGSYVTCWRRLLQWQRMGIWPKVLLILNQHN